jgi:hypothetical protein
MSLLRPEQSKKSARIDEHRAIDTTFGYGYRSPAVKS